MKKIECYIQPYNLDAVAEALAVEGVVGMSVAEVKGIGVHTGFTRGWGAGPPTATATTPPPCRAPRAASASQRCSSCE